MLPEAQPGVIAYVCCQTQWRAAGLGSRIGLDYTACIRLLETYLPTWQAEGARSTEPNPFAALTVADLMQDVQVIEHALIEADQEELDRKREERERSH